MSETIPADPRERAERFRARFEELREEIGKVIESLKEKCLRDKVKIIIGGAALTESFAQEVGADAFAPDAITGTDIVKGWSAG